MGRSSDAWKFARKVFPGGRTHLFCFVPFRLSHTYYATKCGTNYAAKSQAHSKRRAYAFIQGKTMSQGCGIVGMPNVGKSTLFNALTSSQRARAANFPFCTIEPNVGKVWVPDARLNILAAIANSAKITPSQMEFVDIAGLVAGASKGEGLGNKFLSHIREVSAIVQVVRCFDMDGRVGVEEISHVEGSIDPARDIEIINTELLLADIESLDKMKTKIADKKGDEVSKRLDLIERTLEVLGRGRAARNVEISEEEWPIFHSFQLLTSKPVLYCCNVKEEEAVSGNQMVEQVKQIARLEDEGPVDDRVVLISAKLEAELSVIEDIQAQKQLLDMYGLSETGLTKVIRAARKMFQDQVFFTCGPTETRSWKIPVGATASQAAGQIHSDFAKNFIKAETIAYDDYVRYGGEKGAKENGKLRYEGASYIVKDGDVLFFHFRK
jgi:GTP-binding protein YchF